MAQNAVSDSRRRLASVDRNGGCVSSWRGSDWFGVDMRLMHSVGGHTVGTHVGGHRVPPSPSLRHSSGHQWIPRRLFPVTIGIHHRA
jgi:hypothetical protein